MALGVLFLVGVLHWVLFLQTPGTFYTFLDWPNLYVACSILHDALAAGQLPFHVTPYEWSAGTDRFLALPFNLSPFAPQAPSLLLLSPKQFILANTLLLYAVGFAGCLAIRRRYGLSLVVFFVLWALFNFNGYLTAHLAAGHYEWVGYFWLPIYALFVLELVEGPTTYRASIGIALALLMMAMQGAMHMFVWCLLFLGLVLLFSRQNRSLILLALVFSVLLGTFRILPALLQFGERDFIGGYPSCGVLLRALIRLGSWRETSIDGLGWWEYDLYVSVVGVGFLVYFGLYRHVRPLPRESESIARLRVLALPMVIMTVLSLGDTYHVLVRSLPVPGLGLERVTSRFIVIPFVFLLLIAVVRAEAELSALRRLAAYRIVAPPACLGLLGLLMWHSAMWRLTNLQSDRLPDVLPAAVPQAIARADPLYVATVWLSSSASMVALAGMVLVVLRPRPWARAALAGTTITAAVLGIATAVWLLGRS
jgi:hypothetical protein